MIRNVMIGGEEKGDWFDAVLSWATKAKPTPTPPSGGRKSKEEVVKAAQAIKTREQLMPTSGPSEPHTVVPEAPEPPPPPEEEVEVDLTGGLAHLPCGHLSWASPEQDEAARAEGKCCGSWKHSVDWSVCGLHTPVPLNNQRSPERVGGGWPGLCCDPNTGFYIGGVGNDCRCYHNGPERCVVHGAVVPKYAKTADTAEPEESEESDFMDALTPTTDKVQSAVDARGMKRGRRG
jgi:hypothetical protein